ncbi:hypothetical protein ACFRAQ_34620 [Nocardia sp. NPDC056611]|uniref:hypothetical protein n=1 Tax=Nocardia sp. NPDC056611 TaxID=3345877 RepID=UPI00366D8E2F
MKNTAQAAPYVNGNLIASVQSPGGRIEWRDNEPFTAALTVMDYERGIASVRFIVETAEGTSYPMFAKDFLDMIHHSGRVIDGTVEGRWQVVKRGTNYGLRYIGAAA